MGQLLRQLIPIQRNIVPDSVPDITLALINILIDMTYALMAGVNLDYGLYSGIITVLESQE